MSESLPGAHVLDSHSVPRLKYWIQIARLRPRAAVFYIRALRLAREFGDEWSLISATPPHHLLILIRLAKGRHRVVEVGTGSAWGTVVLALTDPARRIRSFDPFEFGQRSRYLELAGDASERITLYKRPGEQTDNDPVDFLFIDASHSHEGTISEFEAWRPNLEPCALVVFHDYWIPEVASAIAELDLDGREMEGLYVWHNG